MEASNEPLMWQQFRPEVKDADRRVLFINGKVAAAFGRTPGIDSIRANMRVGGTPVAIELTPKQHQICEALSPFLTQQGLMLAGIDLIGDFLTEINVTSPTGLRAAQRLYGLNLATTFWDAVEARRLGVASNKQPASGTMVHRKNAIRSAALHNVFRFPFPPKLLLSRHLCRPTYA